MVGGPGKCLDGNKNYQTEKDISDIAQKTKYTIVKCDGSLWQYDTLWLNGWVNEVNPNPEQYLKMFHRTHIDMLDILSVSRCEHTVCG
jgi:hypothetical protein